MKSGNQGKPAVEKKKRRKKGVKKKKKIGLKNVSYLEIWKNIGMLKVVMENQKNGKEDQKIIKLKDIMKIEC